MNWTIDKVKEDLPDVLVRVGKRQIMRGRIAGRKNRFASVYLAENNLTFEVAWETLTRCLNENKPILA